MKRKMKMIPAWVNFVAGLACVGLAVNFFAMAYAPRVIGGQVSIGDLHFGTPKSPEEAAGKIVPLTQNNAPRVPQ